MKTTYRHDWENGYHIVKRLSRSFNTIDEAVKFSEGKQVADIYRSRGRYKVEWTKVIDNNK